VLLDPGTYEVSGQAQGFAQATVTGIVLPVSGAVAADIGFWVESTTTSVEVSDTLVQISLPQPTTHLPILGRRVQHFATLTPTVQVDPQRGQLSFVGGRGVNSNVMLDGTHYNFRFGDATRLQSSVELFNTFHKVGRRRSAILRAGHRPGNRIGRCGRPASPAAAAAKRELRSHNHRSAG
jgi:hypothetical protein